MRLSEFCAEQPAIIDNPRDAVPFSIANPDYPESAFRSRTQGFVKMRAEIDSDGHTREIRVIASNPTGVFDRSAINALRRWQFCPSSSGISYTNGVEITLNFKL